jgi:rfaE bifunctional protein nucleotidyltransferase chain/domain
MTAMQEKISSRDLLIPICETLRIEKKKIGYTSGVFDLLHPGHVQYLEDAKKGCDVLIVGVNSDASVRANKGSSRPIVAADARMRVLAGLASVEYVFPFSERNNNTNVELLKPDVYFKAGDYALEKLSSKPIVESYGGVVVLVPVLPGFSSTAIIESIGMLYGALHAQPTPVTYEPRPAIFVDRDGTIIELVDYLHEPEKLKVIPGALEALKVAQDKGYRIIIVTNQPGIGLGYFTKEDLFATNLALMKEASKVGLAIDKIYYSPYSKADNTACRKPRTGMIERAHQEMQIIVEKSFCIGDMTSDVKLAENAGCTGVLVKTGKGGSDEMYAVDPAHILESLADLPSLL